MKKTKRQRIIQKLDKAFSHFVRQRDADDDGYINCITCGKNKHWKEVDCGHFQSRRYMATRWHEKNASAQCKGCNITGEQYIHGVELDKKWGEGTAEEMVQLARKGAKFTIVELEEKLNYFKERLAN